MKKIEFFCSIERFNLEREVNNFMKNKNVISVSYSTEMVGYNVKHFVCVFYEE